MLQVGKVKLVVNKRGGNARFLSSLRLSRGGSIKTAWQNKSAQKDDDFPWTRLKLNLLHNGWRNVWGPRLLQWINMQTRVNYKSSQTYIQQFVSNNLFHLQQKNQMCIDTHRKPSVLADVCITTVAHRRTKADRCINNSNELENVQKTRRKNDDKTTTRKKDERIRLKIQTTTCSAAHLLYICVWCWAVYNTADYWTSPTNWHWWMTILWR